MAETGSLWGPLDLGDARLRDGFARMSATRQAALADGARPVGWKVGMNDPAVRARAGITSSLTGYLLDRTVPDPAAPIPLDNTVRPGAEVELALHMRAGVPPDADERTAAEAIGAVSAAVEIIDVDPARAGDIAEVLARNVWHRAAIVGPERPWSESLLDEIRVTASRAGKPAIPTVTPRGAIGDPGGLVRFVAGAVTALGAELRAGDIILSGLLAPAPVWVAPGEGLDVDFSSLGALTLRFV